MVRRLALLTVTLAIFGPIARAQPQADSVAAAGTPALIAPPPPPPQQAAGFPVTGRAICADTQRAARFALVTLIPVSQDGSGFGGGRRLSAHTDLDGNFIISNVSPGDYYLTGSLTGYINSATLVQNALSAGSDPAAAVAGVPLVHVSAGGASAALGLQRGAVLSGLVQWDDGSPAGGVSVSAQPVPPAGSATSPAAQAPQFGRGIGNGAFFAGAGGTQTDDRGRFRLTGLAAGQYYLRASVQAPAPQAAADRGYARTLNLSVYAPNKVRRTDATVFTLAAGEERPDLTITLGLAGMHSVAGAVGSSVAAVRSGTVYLTDQTDSTLNRSGVIGPDGSFVVPYVPPGTYTLRVSASSQAGGYGRGGGGSSDPAVRFGPLQESITVTDGDLTGLNLTVTAAAASQ